MIKIVVEFQLVLLYEVLKVDEANDFELWLHNQDDSVIAENMGDKTEEFKAGVSFGNFQVTEGTELTLKQLKNKIEGSQL